MRRRGFLKALGFLALLGARRHPSVKISYPFGPPDDNVLTGLYVYFPDGGIGQITSYNGSAKVATVRRVQ